MPRIVVFLPSWLGDTAMATPTLRLLRQSLGRAVIVGVVRPGMDEVLSGLELLDDLIVADARKALGPAKAASRLVPMKFDACLLLPNSFSSAMTARLAGIRIRVGYDRDGRGMLLTHGIEPLKRLPPKHGYEPVSAVDYYLAAARRLLGVIADERHRRSEELAVTLHPLPLFVRWLAGREPFPLELDGAVRDGVGGDHGDLPVDGEVRERLPGGGRIEEERDRAVAVPAWPPGVRSLRPPGGGGGRHLHGVAAAKVLENVVVQLVHRA